MVVHNSFDYGHHREAKKGVEQHDEGFTPLGRIVFLRLSAHRKVRPGPPLTPQKCRSVIITRGRILTKNEKKINNLRPIIDQNYI